MSSRSIKDVLHKIRLNATQFRQGIPYFEWREAFPHSEPEPMEIYDEARRERSRDLDRARNVRAEEFAKECEEQRKATLEELERIEMKDEEDS